MTSGGVHVGPRVLLFGEALVDEFPDGLVPGGAPLNVACHLRGFGLSPVLVTRIGCDEAGEGLETLLASRGLDPIGVQHDRSRPTGRVRVRLDVDGPRFEIAPEQAFDFIDAEEAVPIARALAPELVYFGTLAQRGPVSRDALAAMLEAAQGLRFLDVNLRPPWNDPSIVTRSLERADVIKLNEDELRSLGLGMETVESEAAELLRVTQSRQVLVTRGSEGAFILSDGGRPTVAVHGMDLAEERFVDSVGAGDAFSAVCIVGLLAEWPLATTLERADAFGRRICGQRGALPQLELYESILLEWSLPRRETP